MVSWDRAKNWVSYYISATWKERTVELLQIENKQHNWSQQISWTVSNKKKNTSTVLRTWLKLCTPILRINCTHPQIQPQDLLAHRILSHLLFTGLHNPDGIRKMYRSTDEWQDCWAVGTLLWDWTDRVTDCAAEPWGAALSQTKLTRSMLWLFRPQDKKKKKKRTEPTAMWISLMESRNVWQGQQLRRSLDFSTELYATWLCLDGSGAKHEEDILSFKQKMPTFIELD